MSTRPAETVLFGSICAGRVSWRAERWSMWGETHDDGEERVLELLVRHLRLHVDTGEPAAVARVRVVPADDVLEATDLLAARGATSAESRLRACRPRTYSGRALDVLDHELVRLVLGVDASLGADDGEREIGRAHV